MLVAQTTRPVQKNWIRDERHRRFGLTRSMGLGRLREKEGKEGSRRGSQDTPAQEQEEKNAAELSV